MTTHPTPDPHAPAPNPAAPVPAGPAPVGPVPANSPSAHPPFPTAREPLRHHRLARTRPGWWRPLLALLLAVATYVVLLVVLLLALVGAGLADARIARWLDAWSGETTIPDDPLGTAVMMSMLALMVPACRLAVRWTGRRGGLDSVAGRVRWGLLGRALWVPAAVLGVAVAASWALDPRPVHPVPQAAWMALVVVLLVPLQAAGEEYVFRGLLPQVVGAWLRSPVWGVLVSLPLFVAGHGYNALGLAGVATFAAAAAWMTWRTGGLEVAIAFHAVNNVVAFGMALLGLADPNAPVTPLAAGLDAAVTLAVVALVEWQWRTRWSHRHVAELAPSA